jgi:hypothetical protein
MSKDKERQDAIEALRADSVNTEFGATIEVSLSQAQSLHKRVYRKQGEVASENDLCSIPRDNICQSVISRSMASRLLEHFDIYKKVEK